MPVKAENKKEKKPTMRSLRAAQTKESLLKAAFELFSVHGYDAVTVEDITTRAGVSKGTFYFHFAAKEAVLTEHFRQVDDLYEETCQKLPKRMPAAQKLLCLVDTMCTFCAESCGVDFLRVIYANQLLHTEHDVNVLNKPGRKIMPILHEIAEKGKAEGDFPTFVDDELFAREVMHLAHGIIYDWCMENGSYDLKEEGHRVFAQVLDMAVAYRRAE